MHRPNSIYLKNILISFIVCLIVLALCLVPHLMPHATTTNQTTSPSQNTTSQTGVANVPSSTSYSQMAKTMLGAYATVMVTSSSTGDSISSGSGIAIAEGGYLATNYHVVNQNISSPTTTEVYVELQIGDELGTAPAEVLWYNANLDIAILKSSQNFKTYANIADRWINSINPLRIAEEVWTLGTPYDSDLFGSFSKGTISSAEGRVITTSVNSVRYLHNYMIQHTADISSGNSGGPLFDSNGNVVGLNTAGLTSTSSKSASGLFFAVPIYPITLVLDKVIDAYENNTSYTSPTLGVIGYDKDYSQIGSSYNLTEDGVYVQEVVETADAFSKGLPAGSVIKGIGNQNCTSSLDSSYIATNRCYDLIYALLRHDSGTNITIFYEYEEASYTLVVELG